MNSPIAAYKPNQDTYTIDASSPIAIGFGSAAGFELMQRGAKMLMSSSLVPKEYQGNLANCAIALNMANRLGADPLMVMQNLYVVHGRPSWSAQFLIASFNQCGRFSAIRYRWGGAEGQDGWSCQAYATEHSSSEVITGPTISIATAKKEGWYSKSGSKWQTIPQLMLMYRAAAWLVRTHAPELSMGLQTAEEVHDVYDAEPDASGSFSVGENINTSMDKLREASLSGSVKPAIKTVMDAPKANYSDVANALQTSNTLDELHEAADLIREVPNEVHRQQLNQIYSERETALQ